MGEGAGRSRIVVAAGSLAALAVLVAACGGGGAGIDARAASDTPAATAPGKQRGTEPETTQPVEEGAGEQPVGEGAGEQPVGAEQQPGGLPPDGKVPPGQQLVRYRGLEFTVPAEWPVYDLAADPTVCVRFDVNAVYLGRPGPEMRCPAQLIGRADAVLVEPLTGSSVAALAKQRGVVNGLAVATDASAAAESQIRAAFLDFGVAVTISVAPTAAVQGAGGQGGGAPGRSIAADILSTFRAVPR